MVYEYDNITEHTMTPNTHQHPQYHIPHNSQSYQQHHLQHRNSFNHGSMPYGHTLNEKTIRRSTSNATVRPKRSFATQSPPSASASTAVSPSPLSVLRDEDHAKSERSCGSPSGVSALSESLKRNAMGHGLSPLGNGRYLAHGVMVDMDEDNQQLHPPDMDGFGDDQEEALFRVEDIGPLHLPNVSTNLDPQREAEHAEDGLSTGISAALNSFLGLFKTGNDSELSSSTTSPPIANLQARRDSNSTVISSQVANDNFGSNSTLRALGRRLSAADIFARQRSASISSPVVAISSFFAGYGNASNAAHQQQNQSQHHPPNVQPSFEQLQNIPGSPTARHIQSQSLRPPSAMSYVDQSSSMLPPLHPGYAPSSSYMAQPRIPMTPSNPMSFCHQQHPYPSQPENEDDLILAPGETPKDRIRALERDVSVLVARLEAMHMRQMAMEAEIEASKRKDQIISGSVESIRDDSKSESASTEDDMRCKASASSKSSETLAMPLLPSLPGGFFLKQSNECCISTAPMVAGGINSSEEVASPPQPHLEVINNDVTLIIPSKETSASSCSYSSSHRADPVAPPRTSFGSSSTTPPTLSSLSVISSPAESSLSAESSWTGSSYFPSQRHRRQSSIASSSSSLANVIGVNSKPAVDNAGVASNTPNPPSSTLNTAINSTLEFLSPVTALLNVPGSTGFVPGPPLTVPRKSSASTSVTTDTQIAAVDALDAQNKGNMPSNSGELHGNDGGGHHQNNQGWGWGLQMPWTWSKSAATPSSTSSNFTAVDTQMEATSSQLLTTVNDEDPSPSPPPPSSSS
jgi:hypothetical protein